MRLKKIALACAMAFTLALPFSGFTANGPVSVVEAASSASVCEKAKTTLTPTVNSVAQVTFTVTKSSKVKLAKDLNTILGITMTNGASKTISVDGVKKKLINKGGTIYIDDKTLVDYVKSISSTTTTVEWTVNTKTAQNLQKFAALSASYSYKIAIDGVVFKNFTSSTVNIGGKTYNYTVNGNSIVFEGDVKSALKGINCATVSYSDAHVLKKHAAVYATPFKRGRRTYYKCTECGKIFSNSSCDKEVTVDDLRTSTFKANSGVLQSTVGPQADGQWYKVKNGVADTSFTGFASNANGWWYIVDGKVDFSVTDIVKGKVNGVSGWWYVKEGKVTEITSVEKTSKGYWVIQNGKVNTSFTGFASNANGWWYAVNGKVTMKTTGIFKGTVDGVTGWWYVKNSKVQSSFTGIASNENGKWYVKNGQVQFDYSGKVVYNGKTYTIKNGKVQ